MSGHWSLLQFSETEMFIVDAADNKPEQNQSCSFLLLYSVKCQVYRQYVPPILLGGGKNGPRGHLRAQYLLLPLPVSIHLKDHTPRHDFSLPPSMNDSLICLTVLRCIELVTLQPRNLRINLFLKRKIIWENQFFDVLHSSSPFNCCSTAPSDQSTKNSYVQISMGTAGPQPRAPDLSVHCRTSTAVEARQ